MKIEHHLDADLIVAYGAGLLDEANALLVSVHLALCPACRADLEVAECIGGVLIDCELPDVPVDPVSDTAIATAAKGPHDPGPAAGRLPGSGRQHVFPQPLRDYAGGDLDDIIWRGLGSGVRQCVINTRGPSTARLLNIPAGERVPEHGHRGTELTLVLSGSFFDRGCWYRRGDVEITDAATIHQPIAGPEDNCICLAVTDAPLKFRGWMARLAQPFLRI